MLPYVAADALSTVKTTDLRVWYSHWSCQGGGQGQIMLLHYRGAVWDSVTLVSRHHQHCAPRGILQYPLHILQTPQLPCTSARQETQKLKQYQVPSYPAPGFV